MATQFDIILSRKEPWGNKARNTFKQRHKFRCRNFFVFCYFKLYLVEMENGNAATVRKIKDEMFMNLIHTVDGFNKNKMSLAGKKFSKFPRINNSFEDLIIIIYIFFQQKMKIKMKRKERKLKDLILFNLQS